MRHVTEAPGAKLCVIDRKPIIGWTGSIISGNRVSTMRALDRLDARGLPGDARDRMQDDETGAVGEKIGRRDALGREPQRPVRLPGDLGGIPEFLRAVARHGVVGNAKAAGVLEDFQPCDRRIVGAPILVADDEGNRSQHLDAVEADISQVAAFELGRERPRREKSRRLDGLFRAEQAD